MPTPSVHPIEIIVDATGNLAAHIIKAVLTQFDRDRFEICLHRFTNAPEAMERVLAEIKTPYALVLHALVDPALKRQVEAACAERQFPCFDLTGPLVRFIAAHSGQEPKNQRGHIHRFDDGYFERIQAMEFTAQHDDSRRLDSIHKADIVLVGLSRVSKSPTSTYLGSMGYKVANVSLSPDVPLPPQLDAVADRTVALTIQPRRLHEIRNQRFLAFNRTIDEAGIDPLSYGDLQAVIREVMWAERLYRDRNYPIINTSRMTVEQTAAHVLEVLHLG